MPYQVLQWLPQLLEGLKVTLFASVIAIFTSLIWGCLIACIYALDNKPANAVIRVLISVFRNSPLLVQMFFCFYCLPYLGIVLPGMVCGILSITLNEGAFVAEIIRGSIKSIPTGEIEAAKSLGLSRLQIVSKIIFPLAFSMSVPMLTGQSSIVIKDTSLLSMIMIVDIMRCGNLFYSKFFSSVSYWIVGLVYVLLFLLFSYAGKLLEKKVLVRR